MLQRQRHDVITSGGQSLLDRLELAHEQVSGRLLSEKPETYVTRLEFRTTRARASAPTYLGSFFRRSES